LTGLDRIGKVFSYENIRGRNIAWATNDRLAREEGGAMHQETELERTIRHLISRASDLKHRRVHALLDEVGLYRGQPPVLRALWEQDGLTQTELTARLGRSPSTITKTVQRLEKAGFVKRGPDESDERISHVYLTDAGRAIQPAVEAVWSRLDAQLFAGFGTQELTLFVDYLTRVCHNIENKV
jgi:DNA-binding MarR family transcriptional regulator